MSKWGFSLIDLQVDFYGDKKVDVFLVDQLIDDEGELILEIDKTQGIWLVLANDDYEIEKEAADQLVKYLDPRMKEKLPVFLNPNFFRIIE